MMMRTFPDHDDEFAHLSSEGHALSANYANVEPFHVHQNAPDPLYYHNAPRHDEGHINTSSYECSTASSASHHTPEHSPKSNATVATTIVHANDVDFSPWQQEERDEPEEVEDYSDEGSYNEACVPHHGQEPGWHGDYPTHYYPPQPPQHGEFHHHGNGGPPNGFVPIPFNAAPNGPHHQVMHYPTHHQIHPQSSFSHPEYEPNFQYHGPPQHYAPQYHHEQHPNDPGYYTSAFDTPLPDNYHHSPSPNGEAIRADDQQSRGRSRNGTAPNQVVGEYNERDILCGRGALMIWHPGNQFFRQLVQTHRQRYFFSRRQEKKNIAMQIMEEVRNHGGRFLRRSQSSDNLNEINVWIEIDDERAYQKTCQALREGAPEIRRQWRNKPSRGANKKTEETKENGSDNAASK